MFEYVNENGSLDIVTNSEPIKREVIEQRADFVHIKFTYPNNWIIEIKQYADKVIYLSNIELEEREPGKLYPKL